MRLEYLELPIKNVRQLYIVIYELGKKLEKLKKELTIFIELKKSNDSYYSNGDYDKLIKTLQIMRELSDEIMRIQEQTIDTKNMWSIERLKKYLNYESNFITCGYIKNKEEN